MKQPDDDPTLRLDTQNGELELRPDNTSLFTHVGEGAMYDHVFVQTGEDEGRMSGSYIFRHAEVFKAIKKHMIRNRFPLHLNMQQPAQCDMDAFDHALDQATGDVQELDGFPEDWTL
jgi:hypothetical protein